MAPKVKCCKSPQWVMKRQKKKGTLWFRFWKCGNCGKDEMTVE